MQRMHISGDAASTARGFAQDLHNKWGVGDGDCSDGVLMLLSIEDRQVRLQGLKNSFKSSQVQTFR